LISRFLPETAFLFVKFQIKEKIMALNEVTITKAIVDRYNAWGPFLAACCFRAKKPQQN